VTGITKDDVSDCVSLLEQFSCNRPEVVVVGVVVVVVAAVVLCCVV